MLPSAWTRQWLPSCGAGSSSFMGPCPCPTPLQDRAGLEASSINSDALSLSLSLSLCLSLSHGEFKKRERKPCARLRGTGAQAAPMRQCSHPSSCITPCIRAGNCWHLDKGSAAISLPPFSAHSQGGWKRRERPSSQREIRNARQRLAQGYT